MLTFKEMHLSVYRQQATRAYPDGEGMVVWNARTPLVGDTDERKSSSVTGLQNLSFFFTISEWRGVMDGRISGCNDIGHNLRCVGDLFTFFDMDYPRDPRGVMRVPYVQMTVPYYVRRILRRTVDAVFKTCEPDGDRKTILIPWETRERWDRQYGQGRGGIEFSTDDETAAYAAECLRDGGESFERSIVNVLRIATNQTARWTDRARVAIRKYHRGGEFSWAVYSPKGGIVMNGGIINHSRDGGHDWSVHT